MKNMKNPNDFYDVRFEDYQGKKRFEVEHPDHKEAVTTAAPDEQSAIVAAAAYWRETWTKESFYARCRVWQKR